MSQSGSGLQDPWASAFTEGEVGVHKQKCKGISLVHLNVSRAWSGDGKKGNCDRSQPCNTGAPGHLGRVLTVCLWEC